MPPNVHPDRPLVRTFIACQQVTQIGSQTTLVGLIEKVTAHADTGHFHATLYCSLSSGRGWHVVQLQIVYFDTNGREISRLLGTSARIEMGQDPLAIRGLPIPLKVPQKGRGVIEFVLIIDGEDSATLELAVR